MFPMLIKFSYILVFGLCSFGISLFLYPLYISFLRKIKAGQQIREDAIGWNDATIFKELHAHKVGTPTMWGWVFLIVTLIMLGIWRLAQYMDIVNYNLVSRQETYILLFAFFGMWLLGLVDDIFNIIGKSKIKGLSARLKLLWMFLFSAAVCYRFVVKLEMTGIYMRPFEYILNTNFLVSAIMFFFTIAIINAINIADGLDGLAGWLSIMVLWALWVITFMIHRYIATTVIAVVIGTMIAFLRFNINPANVFMGDSWALAIWWLVATLTYLISLRVGIVIPFMVLFLIFWMELWSSFLQIFWKKVFKKKLFLIAPFHHLLEKRGRPEHTIVMKLWLIQAILCIVFLVMYFYQYNGI